MKMNKQFSGIDAFRIPAALLVVAIHTSPFYCLNPTLDFLFTYCIGRIAVPFFFMVTGYFVLAPYLQNTKRNNIALKKYLIKTIGLYGAVSLLYLPIILYADNWPGSIGGILKMIFFDGTFYHLWYFPASIIGCALLAVLGKKLSFRWLIGISLCTYLFGLFGDSYYGLIESVPLLSSIYSWIFKFSSYTRNGIFFACIFLILGAWIATKQFRYSESICRLGFMICLILMLVEGYITYVLNLQKHNSMYLFLVPTMFFLFQLLLKKRTNAPLFLRDCSMWIYLLHPIIIILIRGVAKVTRFTDLLITNTLVHYISVCILTITAALGLCILKKRRSLRVPKRTSMDRNS